jgi:DNA-binding transcriptional LysR family regulator
MADWEDIRTFLAVARARTLAAAGRVLDVDYTTVGRRVRALEQELGLTLFERVRDRYVLTEAAEGLRESAERMEDGALALERRALGSDRTVSGVLRIATTDALSQILVLPAIRAMHDRHPDIRAHLLTGPARLNITRREADVAVRYIRPDEGELVSRRLARVAVAYYASRDYLSRRPVPPRGASLRGHDAVGIEEGLLGWSKPLPETRDVLRTNSMSTLVLAVSLGIGLGALHCWMADPNPDLVRLWPDEALEHDDIYLVLHHDVQRTGRVRAFVEAVEERAAEIAPRLEARSR